MTTQNKERLVCATSIESFERSQELAERLSDRILGLAREAGTEGLTIHEAEHRISDHRARGISPRFSELVRRRKLVRIITGYGPPTYRFPQGIPRYLTRYDEETHRSVVVHWLPEFAPTTISKFNGNGE